MNDVDVILCRDDDPEFGKGPVQSLHPVQIVAWLAGSPRNAVVIQGEVPTFVICGAGEGPDDYYYGEMPCEDPDSVADADLTAELAVQDAIKFAHGLP